MNAAQAQGSLTESQLKTAFILNFVRYTEWPDKAFAGSDSPISLCVIGRNEGGIGLSALEGRRVQDRPIRVRLDVSAETAGACQVVFVGEADARRIPTTLRALQNQPVLTISDVEGFIDSGGAIGIVRGEQKLQFEINRTALDKAKLRASSQLLKLARAVLNPGN